MVTEVLGVSDPEDLSVDRADHSSGTYKPTAGEDVSIGEPPGPGRWVSERRWRAVLDDRLLVPAGV
jgi:hypothetical protein